MNNALYVLNSMVKENLSANPCAATSVRTVSECFPQFRKIIHAHLPFSEHSCSEILARKAFALRSSRFAIGRQLIETFPAVSRVGVTRFSRPGGVRIDLFEQIYLFCSARPLPDAGNRSKKHRFGRPRPPPRTSSGGKPSPVVPFLLTYVPRIGPILGRVRWKRR
jgi:hypothetical protein